MFRPPKIWVLILGLCSLELLLFSRSSAHFFDGDDFFYFPYRITHFGDLLRYFTSLDPANQFRPLTHVFFSFVLFPLMGLHVWPYGLLSISFHILNTVLVFFLLRRWAGSDRAAMAGVVFWGLNPVAIYITYGLCFLADYFYAFFYLLSILAFLRDRATKRSWYGVVTCLAFVIALGTKEAAVTLPINLAMLTIAGFARKTLKVSGAPAADLWVGLALFAILFVYLLAYYRIKGSAFYDQGPQDNYRLVLSLTALTSKIDALKSGLYLPFPKYPLPHPRRAQLLIILLAMPLTALGLSTLWGLVRRNAFVVAGVLWMLIALLPVLFIMPTEFVHNLYVPLVGMALIAGLFVDRLSAYISAKIPYVPIKCLWASLFFILLLSLLVNQDIFEHKDWRPYYGKVARRCLQDLRRLHPKLAPHTILYFYGSKEYKENLVWLLYDGQLVKFFYNDRSIYSQFAYRRDPLPEEALLSGRAFVLVYQDDHLDDITRDYLVYSTLRAGLEEFDESLENVD